MLAKDTWNNKTSADKIKLLGVAAHEIGHLLGASEVCMIHEDIITIVLSILI